MHVALKCASTALDRGHIAFDIHTYIEYHFYRIIFRPILYHLRESVNDVIRSALLVIKNEALFLIFYIYLYYY